MGILRWYLKDCVKKSMKNNVRCRVIGRKEELSPDIVQSIENLEEKTKNNTGLNFTIAINYGGRDEITRAVKKIAADVKAGKSIRMILLNRLLQIILIRGSFRTRIFL